MRKLTAQQELFVNEYIKLRCKNAKQAAINAGYSEKTAQSQSSQLLMNPNVSKYLKQRKNEIIQAIQEEFIFDALEARKVMYKILSDNTAADKDRITVARDLLDRAGFKPTDEVKLSGEIKTNPFKDLTTEQLIRLADDNSD